MLALAWRMLVRDWRSGELRLRVAALALAVASVTSVACFSDRLGRALVRDVHQLLGAALVLVSDHPWRAEMGEELARRGLNQARALNSSAWRSSRAQAEASQLAA